MRPSVGVLIPYHNEGALLTECLHSLQRQTLPVDEILIYDDASVTAPQAFIPPALQVRILGDRSNVGPAVARNRLLAHATGEFIHFHDADDWFAPEWHERVSAQLGSDVDCVITEVSSVEPNGVRHENIIGLRELAASSDLLRFALRHALLPLTTTMRRTLVQKVGGYSETLWQSEDYEFHARFALANPIWRAVFEPVVTLRLRPDSRSTKQLEVWRWAWAAVRQLGPQLPASHQPDLAAFAFEIAQKLVVLGDPALARVVYAYARQHGVRENDMSRGHRALAHVVGDLGAARAAALYRTLLPTFLRRRLSWLRRRE